MKATLINNITGAVVEVTATTEHPDSSYGKAVWVDKDNAAYLQVGMSSPFYTLKDIMTETKEEALEKLESLMGCFSAAYIADTQGYNSAYVMCSFNDFFNEDCPDYLPGDDWVFLGERPTGEDDEEIDIDEWTQDVDNRDGGADSLKRSFKDGQLSVMSFFSEKSGYMDIMVWEA